MEICCLVSKIIMTNRFKWILGVLLFSAILYLVFLDSRLSGPKEWINLAASLSARKAVSTDKRNTNNPASALRSPYLLPAPWTAKNSSSAKPQHPQHRSRKAKLVLAYNLPSWFFNQVVSPGGTRETLFRGCEVDACVVTQDRRKLGDVDAVFFHVPDLPSAPPSVPGGPGRPAGQRWVAFNLEPPHQLRRFLGQAKKNWASAFNWTMGFRLQSDIFAPYAMLVPRESTTQERDGQESKQKNYSQIATNKSKSAAWFVSACKTPSRREDYARELAKFYPIDVYGKCGPFRCPGHPEEPKCLDKLNENYKFYLSFESALCPGYVTEKMFKAFGPKINIVPVVRGGTAYKKAFPPGTFIDTADFESAAHLGSYLTYLEKDKKGREEYAAMLREVARYTAVNVLKRSMCKLCEELHTDNWTSIYEDLPDWSFEKIGCKVATDV